MENEIVINGIKYKRVEDTSETVDTPETEEDKDILEDYYPKKEVSESNIEPQTSTIAKQVENVVITTKDIDQEIKRAVPGEYGFKTRLKTKSLKPTDIMTFPKRISKVPEMDLDPGGRLASQAGYNPWMDNGRPIGEGTVIEAL